LISEADSLAELQEFVGRQMRYHNRERRHSGVGNQSPLAYGESEGFDPRQRCTN